MSDKSESVVIGVDVGSGSVRVSLIRFIGGVLDGHPLANAKKDITIHNPITDFYEQNTDEIWSGLRECLQKCLETSKISYKQITGISFSATCSLVIIDKEKNGNDVIMWMDHRSIPEASEITNSKNPVLEQIGGKCSPEFSLAKLCWLSRNQKERFDSAIGFMELPDWLAWRVSNLNPKDYPRSVCSVVCKWGYDAFNKRWRDDLFKLLAMDEFVTNKSRIGEKIVNAGTHIGYMSSKAAKELGLIDNLSQANGDTIPISIASPLIDAHAGVLSMLMFSNEIKSSGEQKLNYDNIFCMIGGTSTCDMISTRQRFFTPGVWGPYYDAIFPGYFVREAGQSTTGLLIEHYIKQNPEYYLKYKDKPIYEIIKDLNSQIIGKQYMNRFVINPCFHGSRLLANPKLRGGTYGLTIKGSSLLDSYHAIIEALTYESKYILDELRIPDLKKVLISGGLAKNDVYMQVQADVFNTEVLTFSLGPEADLMIVGAAILAYHSIYNKQLTEKIVNYPNLKAKLFKPNPQLREYHDVKYQCFREMLDSNAKIEKMLQKIKISKQKKV